MTAQLSFILNRLKVYLKRANRVGWYSFSSIAELYIGLKVWNLSTTPYIYDTYSTPQEALVVSEGFGMCVASVHTNPTSPYAVINPSSLTHACTTSARSEMYSPVFESPQGRTRAKRLRTTNSDTHSLGRSPLSTNQGCLPPPASWCHLLARCQAINRHRVKNSTCQSKAPVLMSAELEQRIMERLACAVKGQNCKRLWWLSFFRLCECVFCSHLSKLRG